MFLSSATKTHVCIWWCEIPLLRCQRLSLSETAGSRSLDRLVLSLVSLPSCLQRAFNRPIDQFAAGEKPLPRVVTVSTVLVDGEFPMGLPPLVLQPANWANVAEILSVEVEVLALEA